MIHILQSNPIHSILFYSRPNLTCQPAAVFFPDQGEDVLSQFDFKKFETSNAINTTSVISALQQSVAGFKTLPASASKTFIFTGNMLNSTPAPGFLLFGAGKATTAYFIRHLVQQKSYQGDGIKYVIYLTDFSVHVVSFFIH